MKLKIKYFNGPLSIILWGLLLLYPMMGVADFPLYPSNPYSFPIADFVHGDPTLDLTGDQFIVADFTGDGLLDFVFRTETHVWAYDHWGESALWSTPCQNPDGNGGAKHGVADLNGDGQLEVIALSASGQVMIINGQTGAVKDAFQVEHLGANQKASHIVVVNLRGEGDLDAIVQTADIMPQGVGYQYYLNRSLIAYNLVTHEELWRREQNSDPSDGYYENYWGQAHGPLVCADVDLDGMDEVVGGTLIEENGDWMGFGYPEDWIGRYEDYISHLDAIAVGDFRNDIPGLEWVILEEDDSDFQSYYTAMLSKSAGIIWRSSAAELKNDPSFIYEIYRLEQCLEPQNVTMGNFDPQRQYCESWNRSRFGGAGDFSQHPWIYDFNGDLIEHYRTDEVLPPGFNNHPSNGNGEGIEMIWTIDWAGGAKEYIAAQARHTIGDVGVFDAMTGDAVFYTGFDFPAVRSVFTYAVDIAGDCREELIICDSTDTGPMIRIYWNEAPSLSSRKPSKWDDPLYKRLKHNWNYYSPGSYTQPELMLVEASLFLEGPYNSTTGQMSSQLTQIGAIPNLSPYSEDPRFVANIPANTTDWVLLELREEQDGPTIAVRSVFLLNDGRLVSELGNDEAIPFRVLEGNYYLVIHHRNHPTIMTARPAHLSAWEPAIYDFSSSESQYFGSGSAVEAEDGTWCAVSGDVNQDQLVTIQDRNQVFLQTQQTGYLDADIDLDGEVTEIDAEFCEAHRNFESPVPLQD